MRRLILRLMPDCVSPPQGTSPLRLALVGGRYPDELVEQELREWLLAADLVVGLGDIDLARLAMLIGPSKPALCVLGDLDPLGQSVPAPFRLLHGDGVVYRGWRIAGLSGGPHAPKGCMHLDEQTAREMITRMPPSDILLAHVPPAGLARRQGGYGLAAFHQRLASAPPLVYCHVGPEREAADVIDETLFLGVWGLAVTPPLEA